MLRCKYKYIVSCLDLITLTESPHDSTQFQQPKMGVPSKRFAVFLCLIILHQDLVIARSHYDLDLATSSSLRSPVYDDIVDDYLPSNQTISTNELTVSSSQALGREKRLIGLILFVVSLVVTVVATTIETIYDIHGCCGLSFSYLCSFEENFKRKREAIHDRARVVDERLQKAIKKKDNLECLSKMIEGFFAEIKRLITLQKEFADNADTDTLVRLIDEESKIQTELQEAGEKANKTNLEDYEHKLDRGKIAMTLSLSTASVALPGFAALGRYTWKLYKVNRLYKTLKATHLEALLKNSPKVKELIGFTGGSVKGFLKGVAKTRFAAKATLATKGMKIVKFGGWFMSVLSIAMDIFSTVSLLMGCYKKVDEAKKAMASLDEPAANVTAMENEIDEYENDIKTNLEDNIVPILRKGRLHNALAQVKQILENLPKEAQSFEFTECVETTIPDALKTFQTSSNFVVLKDELKRVIEECVSPLNYAYECFVSRVKVMKKIKEDCRDGTDNAKNILAEALKEEGTTKSRCEQGGLPYTSDEDFIKSLEDYSKKGKFQLPCQMNSESFKSDVCRRKNSQTPQEIAEIKKMDVVHINKIIKTCKQKDPYTAAEKEYVCGGKMMCDDPEVIKTDFEKKYEDKKISIDQIKNMPCPEIEYEEDEDDCGNIYD